MNPIRTVTFSQNLASGALSYSLAPASLVEKPQAIEILGVYLHFGSAVTQAYSLTFDSKDGSNYDTEIGRAHV